MRRTFLLISGLLLSSFLFSQSPQSNEEIARAYIAAYSDWDFEKMSSFYHDSVSFHDPTAEVSFPRGTYRHKGKAAVKNFFSGVFNNSQPDYVKLRVKDTFASGSIFIFHSDFECVLPSAWFGKDSTESVFISIPLDTIVEIKDGKVYRHTDYGDYTTYGEQIRVQTAK